MKKTKKPPNTGTTDRQKFWHIWENLKDIKTKSFDEILLENLLDYRNPKNPLKDPPSD